MQQQICRKTDAKYLVGTILICLSMAIPQAFAASEDISGDWDLTMDFNGTQMLATLTITGKPDGTLTGKWGSSDLSNFKLDGGKLTFTRTMNMGGQDSTMKFAGTLKDGKLTGTLSSDRGESPVAGAKRRSKAPALGQWDIKYDFGGQELMAKLVISQNAKGAVDANWISEVAKIVVSNVKIEGDKITFSRKTMLDGNGFDSTFNGTVKDDKLTGTIKSEMGDMAVTGQRLGTVLIGKWEITRTTQQGPRTSLLMIDTDLTGRMESLGGEIPIKDLKIDGSQVTFKTELNLGGQSYATEYKMKLDGKTLKGQSVSDRGTNDLAGKKVEPTPAAASRQ